MDRLHNAFTIFMSLMVEAFPFLLLGVLLSSVLLVFVDERQLIARLPRNSFFGALAGSCIGFLFPVCECGNVPVARRLLSQGVPSSVAVGFLLAAPTINPVVIWSTWIAFRDQPEVVGFRILGSLAIATIVGWVFSIEDRPQAMLQPRLLQEIQFRQASTPDPEKPALLQSGSFILGGSGQAVSLGASLGELGMRRPKSFGLWKSFLENVLQELQDLGTMLVFGSAIAALIQVFIPREVVLNLGQGVLSSVLAMMLLAAIVSICSTVDAFFALSFASTFTTGSLLAFLIFGPMIDLKAMGLMLSIFRPRIILYFFALAAQLTLIMALGYSYLN